MSLLNEPIPPFGSFYTPHGRASNTVCEFVNLEEHLEVSVPPKSEGVTSAFVKKQRTKKMKRNIIYKMASEANKNTLLS